MEVIYPMTTIILVIIHPTYNERPSRPIYLPENNVDDKNAYKELQHLYLMKFRKCSSEDTLERVFERLRDKLTGHELDAMMSASDHRRAELRHKQLWDKVPASAWRNL